MKLLNFFKKFYVIYIGLVILSLVFVAPFIGYSFKRNYAIGNMIHIIIAIICVSFLIYLVWLFKNKSNSFYQFICSNNGFNITIALFSVILFLVELLIINGSWFIVGWDTRNVIFPDMQTDSDYMSMYPNQIFLAGLFRSIYNSFKYLNIYNFDSYYLSLVLLSMLCTFITVILITYTQKKITNNLVAFITFIFGAIFIGLSPWIMVPYSDNFAMLCTSICLFSYVCIKNKFIKWPLLFAVSIIGYEVKPTAIFILFSIIFIEIVIFISKHIKKQKLNINKKLMPRTIICMCLIVAFSLFTVKFCNIVKDYDININSEASFSPTHYLMMGINLENKGAWNIDDSNFSRSFDTKNQREIANIKEWQVRLENNGFFGVLAIFYNKTLTNYGDGAFAWEAEKPWSIENKGSNPLIWSIYGIDPNFKHNDNNNYFAYIWQCMWFIVLIGCLFIFFNNKSRKYESAIILSLLAISGFLMVCEPDPRYMLLYVPYMIILSTWGYYSFCKKFSVKIMNKINILNRSANGGADTLNDKFDI